MNILTYGKGHDFEYIGQITFFNRYMCKNCKLRISQRKDDKAKYGLTNDEIVQYGIMWEGSMWENLTCNEIIIKQIIE